MYVSGLFGHNGRDLMIRFVYLVLGLAILCPLEWASSKDEFPTARKVVDPNAGRPTAGDIFESANVVLTVDEHGIPFSLESSVPLPNYVVEALEQWRYTPFKKNGHIVAFQTKVVVPVARKLTPLVERSLEPSWCPSHLEAEALKKGCGLSKEQAQELEAELTEESKPDGPRTELLAYYTTEASKDPERAKAERAKLLTWLVEHDPQNDILGSALAVVNSAGETLADTDTNAKLTKLWTDAMAQHPDDEAIRSHALNFLKVSHPTIALKRLAKLPAWDGTGSWAGEIYASSALGITALNPVTGRPVSAASTGDAAAFGFLLSTKDTRMVLAGLSTMIWAGRSLAAQQQLPTVYKPYCEQLLQHAKELYPQTTQSCDVASGGEMARTPTGTEGATAEFVKKVPPRYPEEARRKLITGSVTFLALVDSSGEIQELRLKSGPLALYRSAYDAVKTWRYRPTMINGKAVSFSTSIVVNFSLSW